MTKASNNRYKLLQINFDVSTFIYWLGTNFGHSFSFLKIKEYNRIHLIVFVLGSPHWPLISGGFLFYIKLYAIVDKKLNLRFRNFKSIFQRMHFLSSATFFLCLWFSVWIDIQILNIFHYQVLTCYHFQFKDKNIRVLGLPIWNHKLWERSHFSKHLKKSLNDWFQSKWVCSLKVTKTEE